MTPERAKELFPIIQAFSEGKKIECKANGIDKDWQYVSNPVWADNTSYRIAKEKKWYRVALCDTCTTTADTEVEEKTYEECEDFIRWLTDRVYYEVD